MDPEARERLPRRPLALSDLVLVMREDQIDTAGVNIDRRLAKQPQRHGRALEVPARPPRGIDNVPGRLAGLRALPQHEVADVLFSVVVRIDPRPRLHALMVETRQLPVVAQGRDLEVDRAITAIGVPVALERRHERAHALQVLRVRRPRHLLHFLEAERPRILQKGGNVLVRVRPQIHARLPSARNRTIVDVREIQHLPHLEPEQMPQRAAQHVHAHEGPKVPDVPSCIDRQAAQVHADAVVSSCRKCFFASRKGVVEAHRLRVDEDYEIGTVVCQRRPPLDDTTISSLPGCP